MRNLIKITMLLSLSANAQTVLELSKQAQRNGFKANALIIKTIRSEALKAHVDAVKLLSIAMLESGLNADAWRVNKNGTVDVGLFQINSVNFEKCQGLDLNTVKGNTRCAVKLIKAHERHREKDADWLCRYHSKTPSRKIAYCMKLESLE